MELKAAKKTDLKKNLTSTDLAALGIGAVLGTGIFVSTGVGAHMAGRQLFYHLLWPQ